MAKNNFLIISISFMLSLFSFQSRAEDDKNIPDSSTREKATVVLKITRIVKKTPLFKQIKKLPNNRKVFSINDDGKTIDLSDLASYLRNIAGSMKSETFTVVNINGEKEFYNGKGGIKSSSSNGKNKTKRRAPISLSIEDLNINGRNLIIYAIETDPNHSTDTLGFISFTVQIESEQ